MSELKDMPGEIWVYEGKYDDHTWIPHEKGYTSKGGGTFYRRADLAERDGWKKIENRE